MNLTIYIVLCYCHSSHWSVLFGFHQNNSCSRWVPYTLKNLRDSRFSPDFGWYFIINHRKCYYLVGKKTKVKVVWLISK